MMRKDIVALTHLLLAAIWIEEVLASRFNCLEGTSKLGLVHKTWSTCSAGGIRDTHQVRRLKTKIDIEDKVDWATRRH